jgi:hypothetical protein
MRLTRSRWIGVLTVALVGYPAVAASTADGADFRVGADKDLKPARIGVAIESVGLNRRRDEARPGLSQRGQAATA